jgi:hypothetical protein
VHHPWFNYDPELFWNAVPKKATAILPPGPRNPAGAAWIGDAAITKMATQNFFSAVISQ